MNGKKTDWFCEARFGMFIHWGLYAIPGQGEWYMSFDKVNAKVYEKYFSEFNPREFNPRQWAQLAKEAGMKYIVLTAKHHDGFCLFDSQYTDYKSTNTKAGKDFIKEYVEAVREAGLRVGIYYSLLDWHHPDYPKYNDMFHPMRENEAYKEDKYDWDNYLNYMHKQIEELCSNYGKLDLLWFDFSYGDMRGEKWNATKLMEMVRRLQPEALVNDRLEGGGSSHGSIMEGQPSPIAGDFASPEQCMPTKELCNKNGERVIWELCTTINDSWGYTPSDRNYKSSEFIIHKLVECVSKSGNLILNVGPDSQGRIPEEQAEILRKIGAWMKINGESIYGCEGAKMPRPEWGRYTQKENILYAHIMEAPIGPIPITGVVKEQIENIRVLWDGSEAKDASMALGPRKNPDTWFITLGSNGNHTYPLPIEADTVLKIRIKE